jgi:cell division protein FtsQ
MTDVPPPPVPPPPVLVSPVPPPPVLVSPVPVSAAGGPDTASAEPAGGAPESRGAASPGGHGGRGAGAGMGPTTRGNRGRHPRSRWRAAFFTLAGFAIVVGVTWALLGNRVFVVRSVTVTGAHLLSASQVVAAAAVPLGTPLLRVDAGAVTSRVEALNLVASATVTEDWPDHLVIVVTERVPVLAVAMADGGYDQVDADGVIVRWTKGRPATLPVLATALPGSALRSAPAIAAAADVLAELQPALAKQVTQVTVASVTAAGQQVTLGLRGGQTVQWGAAADAARKNRELAILLPQGARDIDVSDPGTVVTR